VRRLLWFAAFLIVLPAWAYGLSTGRLILAFTGLPLAAFLIYLSLQTIACPSCAKTFRTIGMRFSHCPHCGTKYE
jgi:hypothetical protein